MNTSLRAFLVDDEILANRELRNLLSDIPEVEVVGEARSVGEAAEKIPLAKPDVIFLDIELRDGLGFDLIPKIDADIEVIFVTAYEQYALRAFAINALDYLTKPIDFDRLHQSIERLLSSPKKRPPSNPLALENDDRMLLRIGNKNLFCPVNDIILIHALGDYTEVTTLTHGKGLILKSMQEWENTLPKNLFFRTHRASIINIQDFKEMSQTEEGEVSVLLNHSSDMIPVSRRNLAALRKILKKI
ncbi:MAG: LytTR family DNA-binding domain-containing protein [Verrucomicrobiota bacterium]|nr:LytTR family DNA-binding domain-containing protein [Verrucomicrobiota bacterium]